MTRVAVDSPQKGNNARPDARAGDTRVCAREPVDVAWSGSRVRTARPCAHVHVGGRHIDRGVCHLKHPDLAEGVVATDVHCRSRSPAETQGTVVIHLPPAIPQRRTGRKSSEREAEYDGALPVISDELVEGDEEIVI